MILARLIVDRYQPSEALLVLQELFQELGAPDDMRPFTLYGSVGDATGQPQSSEALIEKLKSFLKQRQA
jgi:hypothetical protein